MLCALCLARIGIGDDENPREAITIANGHAVCEGHFVLIRHDTNNSAGPVALNYAGDERFRGR